MSRKILITRPYESAIKFSGQIAEHYHRNDQENEPWDCVIAPLLMAKYDGADFGPRSYLCEFPPSLCDKNFATIISSAQIFKTEFFAKNCDDLRAQPFFCVGADTANLAAINGLTPIHASPLIRQASLKRSPLNHTPPNQPPLHHATMNDAIQSLRTTLPPGTDILYLRGAEVSHNLPALLPDYHVHEIILYAMIAQPDLEKSVLDIFPALNVITVFSRRSALILREVLEKYHLSQAIQSMTLLAISTGATAPLTHYAWRNIRVAHTPNAKGMIEALETYP